MSTVTITPQSNPLASQLVEIVGLDETVCANVTGGAGNLNLVEIDNTLNGVDDTYVKLYDDGAPTVGSTGPNWILKADAGEKITYALPKSSAFTALSAAALKSPGTAGTTGPDNSVTVRFLVS